MGPSAGWAERPPRWSSPGTSTGCCPRERGVSGLLPPKLENQEKRRGCPVTWRQVHGSSRREITAAPPAPSCKGVPFIYRNSELEFHGATRKNDHVLHTGVNADLAVMDMARRVMLESGTSERGGQKGPGGAHPASGAGHTGQEHSQCMA